MARIFLDTNVYIDVIKRSKERWSYLERESLFISPLSTHVLFYVAKLKVPNTALEELKEQFGTVALTKEILDKALQGPTSDLEDNIQLHSAVEADCDLFLTEDKELLNMKFFGKIQILENGLGKI
jgi:predicted nucleic acid-binding protein